MQVVRIKGPDQIFTDAGTSGDSASVGEASDSSYNKFTCELNGIVSGDVTVTFRFYDNRGNSMEKEETLPVKQNNITEDNKFYFTITPEKALSGSSIYIHAIIPNSDTNAQNVSFGKSSYHETIKHVQVCAEKKINLVYWSGNDQIDKKKMAEQENIKDKAGASDKRYIHIKTAGMYSDVVKLTISAGDDTTELQKINVPLHRNHQVVPVSMEDALARYCSIKGLSGEKAKGLTLNLKAAVTFKDDKYTLKGQDSTMELKGDKPENKEVSATNGAVLVTVDKGSNYEEKPVRYTDFLIGYMCHIEGVGKLAKANDNDAKVTGEKNADYTIYPFHVYEIKLGDLVNCGLVTLDEAAYLTTKDNNKKDLREKEELEEKFNKIDDKISSDKTLLSLFQDRTNKNRTNSSAIRNVLTQVCHKPTEFSKQKFICRDAWEIVSSKNVDETKEEERKTEDGKTQTVIIKRKGREVTKIHPRPDGDRYSKHKECPFGEFFLNYLPGDNFKVYASRNIGDRVINEYKEDEQTGRPDSPNPIDRGEVAIHRGGSIYSTGCITFNINYGVGNYNDFNIFVYPPKVNNNATHVNKLNFLCIDERNAIKVPNDKMKYTGDEELKNIPEVGTGKKITIKKNDSFDFNRYYDLIKPKNGIPVVTTTEKIKETVDTTKTTTK